ncbi:uncharacterized protein LOC144059307 isoform X2 [Vanacampus margaritifer]
MQVMFGQLILGSSLACDSTASERREDHDYPGADFKSYQHKYKQECTFPAGLETSLRKMGERRTLLVSSCSLVYRRNADLAPRCCGAVVGRLKSVQITLSPDRLARLHLLPHPKGEGTGSKEIQRLEESQKGMEVGILGNVLGSNTFNQKANIPNFF